MPLPLPFDRPPEEMQREVALQSYANWTNLDLDLDLDLDLELDLELEVALQSYMSIPEQTSYEVRVMS